MEIMKAEIKRELLHCKTCEKYVLHLPEELFPNSASIQAGWKRVRVWKCPLCRNLVKFLPGDLERVRTSRKVLELNSEFGQVIGWTDDKFKGVIKVKNRVLWIHCLVSIDPGKGNIDRLFKKIWSLGYTIKVTMVLPSMIALVKDKGFKKGYELMELWMDGASIMGEVWTK